MNTQLQERLPQPWTFPYPDREMYTKEQMLHFAEQIAKEAIDEIYTVGYKPSNDINADITELFILRLKYRFGIKPTKDYHDPNETN